MQNFLYATLCLTIWILYLVIVCVYLPKLQVYRNVILYFIFDVISYFSP